MQKIYFTFISENDFFDLNNSLFLNFMKANVAFDKAIVFYNDELIDRISEKEVIDAKGFEDKINDVIKNELPDILVKIIKISGENNSDSFFSSIYNEFKEYPNGEIYFNSKSGSPTQREVFNFIASFNSNTSIIEYNTSRGTKPHDPIGRFKDIDFKDTERSYLYKLKIQNSYNYYQLFNYALKTGNVYEAKRLFDAYNLFANNEKIKECLDYLNENQFLSNSDFRLNDNEKNETSFRNKINKLYNKLLTYDRKGLYYAAVSIVLNIVVGCEYYNSFKALANQNSDFLDQFKEKQIKSFYGNIFEFPKTPGVVAVNDKIILNNVTTLKKYVNLRNSLEHNKLDAKQKDIYGEMKNSMLSLLMSFNKLGKEKCVDYYREIEKEMLKYDIFNSHESKNDVNNNEKVDLVAFIGGNDPHNATGEDGSILNIYKTLKNKDVKINNVYLISTKGIYEDILKEDEVKEAIDKNQKVLELFKKYFNDSFVHIIPFKKDICINPNKDENLWCEIEEDDFSNKNLIFEKVFNIITTIKTKNNKIVLSGSSGAFDLQNAMKILPSIIDDVYCYYTDYKKRNAHISDKKEFDKNYMGIRKYNSIYLKARYKNMLDNATLNKDIVTIKFIFDTLSENNLLNNENTKLYEEINDIYTIYKGTYTDKIDNYKLDSLVKRYKLIYAYVSSYNHNNEKQIGYDFCYKGIQPLYQKLFESQILNYKQTIINNDNKNLVDKVFCAIKKRLYLAIDNNQDNKNNLRKLGFIFNSKDKEPIKVNLISKIPNARELSYDCLLGLIINKKKQFMEAEIMALSEAYSLRNGIEHPNEYKTKIEELRKKYGYDKFEKAICSNLDKCLINMYNCNVGYISNMKNEINEYFNTIEACKSLLDY